METSKPARRTTCQECNRPIEQSGLGRPRLYCSTACANTHSIRNRGIQTIFVVTPKFNKRTGEFDTETFTFDPLRSSGALDSMQGHGPDEGDFGGVIGTLNLEAPADPTVPFDTSFLNSLPPIFEGFMANEPEDRVDAMLARLKHAARWWRAHGCVEPLDVYLRPLVTALINELRVAR